MCRCGCTGCLCVFLAGSTAALLTRRGGCGYGGHNGTGGAGGSAAGGRREKLIER